MARRHIMESTFRLNLLNPQHAKINEVIKGLNPKIYKSKNQFLIEACEFYIDHYGEDDILILSILVDTFISKISFPMQPGPEIGSISDA